MDKHGGSSWEVDALPPEVLGQIIREAFDRIIDREKMDAIKQSEENDKGLLRALVKRKGSGR